MQIKSNARDAKFKEKTQQIFKVNNLFLSVLTTMQRTERSFPFFLRVKQKNKSCKKIQRDNMFKRAITLHTDTKLSQKLIQVEQSYHLNQ